jgi:hypothetical protein
MLEFDQTYIAAIIAAKKLPPNSGSAAHCAKTGACDNSASSRQNNLFHLESMVVG